MQFRTDLAMECVSKQGNWVENGIKSETEQIDGITINKITVSNEAGATRIGKDIGQYITLQIPSFSEVSDNYNGQIRAVAAQIENMIPKAGTVLVVGLGNQSVTPDNIGPKTINRILATRHLSQEFCKSCGLDNLRSVAALSFGVLGQTGIESSEIVKSVANKIKPTAIIAVDALASRSIDRLGTTIQLTDTGISPGSGVGNHRKEISKKLLGIPVIAIGVPTVVDCVTLAGDLLCNNKDDINDIRNNISPKAAQMMVTPREIDLLIDKAAYVLSLSINMALQPELSERDILALIS